MQNTENFFLYKTGGGTNLHIMMLIAIFTNFANS